MRHENDACHVAGRVSRAGLASLVDGDGRTSGSGVLVGLVQVDGRGRGRAGDGCNPRRLVIAGHDGELTDVDGVGREGHAVVAVGGVLGHAGGHSTRHGAGHNVGRGRAVDVLIHVRVEAEDTAESRALQRRTEVTALLSRDEQLVLQQGGFADRCQHEVAAFQRSLVDVEGLAGFQHVILAVRGAQVAETANASIRVADVGGHAVDTAVEELVNLTEHGAVNRTGNRNHARPEVDVHQVLEGLAGLAVQNGETVVEPLVQRHLHVGRLGVLIAQGDPVRLAANLERARPTCVHNVAKLADFVLEIAVNEIGDDHVLLENGQAFVCPTICYLPFQAGRVISARLCMSPCRSDYIFTRCLTNLMQHSSRLKCSVDSSRSKWLQCRQTTPITCSPIW